MKDEDDDDGSTSKPLLAEQVIAHNVMIPKDSSSSSSVLCDEHVINTSDCGNEEEANGNESGREVRSRTDGSDDEDGSSNNSCSSSSSSSSCSSSSSSSSDSFAEDDTESTDSDSVVPEQQQSKQQQQPSSSSQSRPPPPAQDTGQDDDEAYHYDDYAQKVRIWTERIPIGLGLCPWAMKSRSLGRLQYTTCRDTTPNDVAIRIVSEAKKLIFGDYRCCRRHHHQTSVADDSCLTNDTDVGLPPPPPLTSTLVVCPHVIAWNDDFEVFDDFVKNFARHVPKGPQHEGCCQFVQDNVTLVSFHPQFLRWRGLATGIQVGSIVESHVNTTGILGKKSTDVFPATVLETNNPMFGQRKIKVRFHHDDVKKEQYVPTDWLVVASTTTTTDDGVDDMMDSSLLGPPLPDNAMHRAPYPTVHLIRNVDLIIPCRDVSRVKRKNAQRMTKLGWEGVVQMAAPG